MSDEPGTADQALRVDRWLWCVRFFKTRSLAAEAVKAGHVKINGQRTKAAHDVKVGDALQVVKGRNRFEVQVERIPPRRGPAAEAERCYTETPESIERRAQARSRRREPALAAPTSGRPDKRTRRLLRRRQRDDG